MIRRMVFVALVASAGIVGSTQNSQAYDPYFGSPLGYSGVGFQYNYRNRLPTPPYFSIFPPVYYGRRYERPYGDSPFASMSQLGGDSSYRIRPKQSPVQWGSPYAGSTMIPMQSIGQDNDNNSTAPVAVIGKHVTIINPFVHSDLATTKTE